MNYYFDPFFGAEWVMDPFALKFHCPIQTNFVTCENSFNYIRISFQDLYRGLLDASEGILDDVDMMKVEKTDS